LGHSSGEGARVGVANWANTSSYAPARDGSEVARAVAEREKLGSAENVFVPRLTELEDGWPAALIPVRSSIFERMRLHRLGLPRHPTERVVLIWPFEKTAQFVDGGLQILVDGQLVAHIGDRVQLGGGFVDQSRTDVEGAESLIGIAISEIGVAWMAVLDDPGSWG
jgi:hypothetical protein